MPTTRSSAGSTGAGREIRSTPVFQRRKFFRGRMDVTWLEPSGAEMTERAWNDGHAKCLGMRLDGDRIGEANERGEPVRGNTVLVYLNAHDGPVPLALPPAKPGQKWVRMLDTAEPKEGRPVLEGRSIVLFEMK